VSVVVVRRAESADFDAVDRIQTDAGRKRFAEEGWLRLIDAERGAFVAESDERVVGWASTHFQACDDGPAGAGHYLAGVTVHPRRRRRGIGHALIAARLEWIAERADAAWYFANARNAASIRAHESFGFIEAGRADSFHGVAFDGGVGVVFRAGVTPHVFSNLYKLG